MPGTVIIGAGQAGYQVAESLRHEGYADPITLTGEESYVPYQRPPLSKAYLLGKTSEEQLSFRTQAYYREHGIDLRLNTRVIGIDRAARRITTSGNTVIDYENLVFTTGARVRQLPVPGADLQGVHYLRTLDDIKQIQASMQQARRAVVIGGGFIGLEFAAAAQTLGLQVTVLEANDRLMARVVSPVVSAYFHELHAAHGVRVMHKTSVSRLHGDKIAGKKISEVECADGSCYPADLVIVGIGVIANDELARDSGIACDRGIIVNGVGRTSDPQVYAAGDCAIYEHPWAGQRVRLESVQNAVDQARTVAMAICGREQTYDTVPWFWSDQYETKLQMVGLSTGYDSNVTRGDMTVGKFSVFYFRQGKLRAIDSINKPADHIIGRKLLAQGNTLTAAQAADESYALKSALS